MMKLKIQIGIFILAILVISCVTEFNAKLPSNDERILIVDGNIIEDSVVTFYVGKSVPLDSLVNAQSNLIADAKITIFGSNGYQSAPAIYSGKGIYSLKVGTLDDNAEYGIQIEYNGDTYQSKPAKPLYTPEIDSVSWVQPDSTGNVSFFVSTHDADTNGAKFFMWNYREDWEVTANYYTTVFFNPADSTFYQAIPTHYYCWKNSVSNQYLIGSTETLKENRIINKQLYQSDPDDSRFSYLYSVNINQKVISKGAYDYYQNKITLNQNMGGLFTPQPSEVIGNIVCTTDPSKKVMGYVDVIKNITQKRIFVYSNQLTHSFRYSDCSTFTNDSALSIMSKSGSAYVDFYNLGYRPAGQEMDMRKYPEMIPMEWAAGYCTDCVIAGGSKNKPDFWPNNDQ